jgi:hypothetical protein
VNNAATQTEPLIDLGERIGTVRAGGQSQGTVLCAQHARLMREAHGENHQHQLRSCLRPRRNYAHYSTAKAGSNNDQVPGPRWRRTTSRRTLSCRAVATELTPPTGEPPLRPPCPQAASAPWTRSPGRGLLAGSECDYLTTQSHGRWRTDLGFCASRDCEFTHKYPRRRST